jgi:ElaB/YqjD/DUF883 family membrane-anchored ribosome-binding protein
MVARNDNDTGGEGRSRGRAGEAYEAARTRTYSAYEAARGRASDVTRQATEQVAVYPVAAVVGGIAVGALLGWLLPRTRREEELLAPAGRRITEVARDAAQRGVDAGKQQIDEIRSKAAQKVGEAVVEAVGGGGKE